MIQFRTQLKKPISGFCVFCVEFIVLLIGLPASVIFGQPLIGSLISKVPFLKPLLRILINFSMFWPQMLLAPHGFMVRATGPSRAHLDSGLGTALMVIIWLFVGAIFGWLSRSWSLRKKVLLSLPFLFVIVIGNNYLMHTLGFLPYLEGP